MRFLLCIGLLSAALAGPAAGQTSAIGHTAPKHKAVVAAKTTTKSPVKSGAKATKHVPVVAPRHPGPPRHATEMARKPAGKAAKLAKRVAPPTPAKPVVPKKPPAPPPDPHIGTNTGLHLPRYASLKSDEVNMRSGPGDRYPVQWTYKRRELPVRIEREFDIWRLVEDMDGVKGWVHQATLTGRRTFVLTGTADHTLRADASDTAEAVAILKPGVVGRVKSCEAAKLWCQVQVQDYRGWLQRSEVWGVDADEVVAP